MSLGTEKKKYLEKRQKKDNLPLLFLSHFQISKHRTIRVKQAEYIHHGNKGQRERDKEKERERYVHEGERDRTSVILIIKTRVGIRDRDSLCVCVCVREREKGEREKDMCMKVREIEPLLSL